MTIYELSFQCDIECRNKSLKYEWTNKKIIDSRSSKKIQWNLFNKRLMTRIDYVINYMNT